MAEPLQILMEDNHCIVVVKPAPLLTQGPPRAPNLEAMVKAYVKEKYGKAGNVYLGVPHRLDRPVSGVVVFARNSKAAQRLAEQFQQRQVLKIYWGAVSGELEPREGEWRDWMRKVPEEARSEITQANADGAREASLGFRLLQSCPEGSLIEFQPRTGRMHQIRLQASHHGHPIVGDSLYGSRLSFGTPTEVDRDRIIALHARSLTFLHPIRYEPVTAVAPLPAIWQTLGIHDPLVQG